MSTHRIINSGPLALLVALDGLHVTSLTVKPSWRYRQYLFLPIAALATYITFYSEISMEEFNSTYAIGCRVMSIVLSASCDIFLCNPQRDFNSIPKAQTPIYEQPLPSRLWWALRAWFNPRGINFAHEPKEKIAPHPQHMSKLAFIRRQLGNMVPYIVVLELSTLLSIHNPYFYRLVDPSSITGARILWRLASISYWIYPPALTTIEYGIFSIIGVTTGLSSPSNWPDLFGSVGDAYTLRRFWGVYWHQVFRRIFTMHADFFASTLGLPPKGLVQRYFKLFVVFSLSGLLHMTGDIVGMGSMKRSKIMSLFVLQAVMITTEDVVLALCQKAGLRKTWWSKLLGYSWVFLALTWSTAIGADPQFREGIANGFEPRVSILQKFLTGSWTYTIPEKLH